MAIDQAFSMWLLGALAGSMLFFVLVVAPKVFQTLPPEQASGFLRAFFRGYYLWGLALAAAAALAALWSLPLIALACALVALLFAYARQVLMPKINDARDTAARGETDAGVRFKRLHLLSVFINGIQLLILLAAAAALPWSS